MKSPWKHLCCVLAALAVVSSTRAVSANDLILEYDPDEALTADELSVPAPTPSRSPAPQTRFLEGYQQLFQLSEQEIQGLNAVLFPLQQDISSIDAQVQYITAQAERMRRQEAVVSGKIQGLQELYDKLYIQDQFLNLEMKGVVQKFEKLLVLYYRIKREFVMEDGRFNLAQLFVHSDAPSEVVFQDYLMGKIQSQLVEQMHLVSSRQFQLTALRNELMALQEQMELYREQVQQSALVLAQQSSFQQQLLRDKQEEQQFFQKALEEAIEEQKIIMKRVQDLAGGISPQAYQNFPDEQFQWPVDPLLGISAHFQDEGYRKRFGIDHNAIDIPTDQLTPVRAPLSGRVLKFHDGGETGYSYLQLAHRDGFSTVYGHLYSSKVKEGDVVQQGQVIALSGGAIGTHGAGRLTTGPHLHFEILKDGKYVDPLEYLVDFDG
ncbi:MAG: murein hydrolase activator EnvC [Candidatus Altimarinota bacterium]